MSTVSSLKYGKSVVKSQVRQKVALVQVLQGDVQVSHTLALFQVPDGQVARQLVDEA